MSNEVYHVIRQLALILGIMSIAVAGCGTSNANPGPTPTATTRPQPTSPPVKSGRVLLHLSVPSQDYTTKTITSTGAGWRLFYHLKCQNPGPISHSGMFFMVTSIDPKHPNGYETIVVYSLGRIPSGSSDPQPAGKFKLRIISYAGCNWNVNVRNLVKT
jgi:hypothetical protein